MNYDITTPDSAYSWIYDALKINQGQFLEDYILKYKKDLDVLCEMYKIQIDKLDVRKLEIIAFQVTSVSTR